MIEQTSREAWKDLDECGRCGHTALHHAMFGAMECQHPTGCACHEFRTTPATLPTVPDTIAHGMINELITELENVAADLADEAGASWPELADLLNRAIAALKLQA